MALLNLVFLMLMDGLYLTSFTLILWIKQIVHPKIIDGMDLDLVNCPKSEELYESIISGDGTEKNSIDLAMIKDETIYGCMSPCIKLTHSDPYGLNVREDNQNLHLALLSIN